MAEIILAESAAPATPASGKVSLYAKSDGLVYSKDDTGNETVLSSAGLTQDQVLNRMAYRA